MTNPGKNPDTHDRLDTAALWPKIRLAALENAIKFKGAANPKAVLGSVLKAHPAAREKANLPIVTKEIETVVGEVNGLSLELQEAELLKLRPDYKEQEQIAKAKRKAARHELPELPGAVPGKVRTRMPPGPSKYNHLGHAISFLINYLYAKKYDGTCILRFDDTNPEEERQEYVDAMNEDLLEYLGLVPDETIFVSDKMPQFYASAAELIERGLAYTCSCPSEEISKQRRAMTPCKCRDKDKEAVMGDWVEMVEGRIEEGALTLRLKIDMGHKNAVMRDPVIMRLCTEPHYRQKDLYKVWPMYDFESALADGWFGITHVMRSNEFDTRRELHNHIKELFGLPLCEYLHYGRFAVAGMTTKGREIREAIESGTMIGWDDPRLLTLRALRRRGIVPEAYVELAKQIGLSKTQTNLDFGVIAAINRQILDEEANRYFFVEEPIPIEVADWPTDLKEVELKLHPHHRRGGRSLKLDGRFFLAKKDYDALVKGGKVFRLIDTINLRYDKKSNGGEFVVHSRTIDEYRAVPKEEKGGLIHFLPRAGLLRAALFLPDATTVTGYVEPAAAQLTEGAIIQFERCCFARLDAIETSYAANGDGGEGDDALAKGKERNLYTFWFAHE